MKLFVSFFTTLIVSSSANNVNDFLDRCYLSEASCVWGCSRAGYSDSIDRAYCEIDCHKNSQPCYSGCLHASRSSNEISKSSLITSSSARHPRNCLDSCQLSENSCISECNDVFCEIDCYNDSVSCFLSCPHDSGSTNEISKSKDTQSLSLRGSSTVITNLVQEVANRDQDANLIQDESQCKSIYSECSSNSDCCGELDCVDFGANGLSISFCQFIPEDQQCRSIGSNCSFNGDCCGDMICREFGDPGYFSRLLCDDNE